MSAPTSELPASDLELTSTRWINTPRASVWEHHVDPTKLAQWWGPAGFTNTFETYDLRPGGLWRLSMHAPDGAVYRMEKRFVEVAAPERIVHDHLDPSHAFRMTVALTEEAGGTRVTWRMCFESAEEFARVKDFIAGANEQNFDRLESLLSTKP
jgi:uncharacterized protein YndB with AHSA1/START domain